MVVGSVKMTAVALTFLFVALALAQHERELNAHLSGEAHSTKSMGITNDNVVFDWENVVERKATPADIRLPPGFELSVWNKHTPIGRSMAVVDNEDAVIVYVSTLGIFSARPSFADLTQNPDGSPVIREVYAILAQDKKAGETKIRDTTKTMVAWKAPEGRVADFPNGIAVDKKGVLYIAEVERIWKCEGINAAVVAGTDLPYAGCVVIKEKMSPELHHGWRYIAFDPVDDNLYIQVGAPCNLCENTPPFSNKAPGSAPYNEQKPAYYATIGHFKRGADGELDMSTMHIDGTGVRNSLGFDWTSDGALAGEGPTPYFTNNGPDDAGDPGPVDGSNPWIVGEDSFNRLITGKDYGYPYCHIMGDGPDALRKTAVPMTERKLEDSAERKLLEHFGPEAEQVHPTKDGYSWYDDMVYGAGNASWPGPTCKNPAPLDLQGPTQPMGPHMATLGMRFYKGTQFPAPWQGGKVAIIAQHGSWNRGTHPGGGYRKIGFRVVYVALDEKGNSKKYGVFACGWLNDGHTYGRPVDVVNLPDGSVLISDDTADQIYRVQYTGAGATELEDAPDCDKELYGAGTAPPTEAPAPSPADEAAAPSPADEAAASPAGASPAASPGAAPAAGPADAAPAPAPAEDDKQASAAQSSQSIGFFFALLALMKSIF